MVARQCAGGDRPVRRARGPSRRGHRQQRQDRREDRRFQCRVCSVHLVGPVDDEHDLRDKRRDLGVDNAGDHEHHRDHTDRLCVERDGDGHLGRLVMGALIPNSSLWYMARGTGFVAVIMLTISVTLGILTTMHWSAPRWPRFVTATLHKNISLLSVIFLATHVLSTLFDSVSPVHLLNAIVPFTGRYRPLGIGLGVVAIDLLAALVITSLLRQRIGYRAWRAVHWSAYACWPFAMLHGLESGTDASTPWARVAYLSCAALVAAGVAWRGIAALNRPAATRGDNRRRGVAYPGVTR